LIVPTAGDVEPRQKPDVAKPRKIGQKVLKPRSKLDFRAADVARQGLARRPDVDFEGRTDDADRRDFERRGALKTRIGERHGAKA
jgi:hypothetical protein